MQKLFDYADIYLKECTWRDLTLVKFCLAAIGVLIGLQVSREKRKCVGIAALVVFLLTYIPLMSKFFGVVAREEKCGAEGGEG